MTDNQFEQLMTVLNSINDKLNIVTAKETDKDKFGLSDVWSELSSVTSEISNVESAVNGVKSSILSLKESVDRLDR